jgi:DNA-binding response OmpR family regulator
MLKERSAASVEETPQTRINSNARLLVAEAPTALSSLVDLFQPLGYRVDQAHSAQETLDWLDDAPFDLLILDTAVPGMSDAELVSRARQLQHDLLIVVLTAHATVESTIAAIKANVVDYLLKPCRPNDLLMTVTRAVDERLQSMRRQQSFERLREAMNALDQPDRVREPAPSMPTPAMTTQVIENGMLSFDREKRMVTLQSNPPRTVELTDGEASVLVALMEKPNQVFTYNQLAKTALGYEGMDKWTVESVIRSTVFRLRHKIEGAADAPQLIRTVRGRGYFISLA